jgi:predicted metallopeptidase
VSKRKKPAAKVSEKKTPGTVIMEKYRPRMNKLTDAEREKLMAHAMVTIYGQPENAARR